MGETRPRVLVVGAGAAGSAAAAELARAGTVDVVVVGAEPRIPNNFRIDLYKDGWNSWPRGKGAP
ncbi:NAD(P)-binding protein [Micromonospora okii]|uniref:NAD(P)-binding protein n=1 Tax=Micromonospora okii TaxID=1182970 RepID=UPI00357107E9